MQSFVVAALLVLGLAATEISGDAPSSLPVSGNGCTEASAQAVTDCAGKVGCPVVNCDGDDYAPTQCEGNWCRCVQKDNTQIGDYGHDLHNNLVGLICGCVRAWVNARVDIPQLTDEEFEKAIKLSCLSY